MFGYLNLLSFCSQKKSEAGRTGQEDADLLEHAKECHWEEGL